jgi:threonylcarbamoyladenosine tRNA methylthiotransferase MtaB
VSTLLDQTAVPRLRLTSIAPWQFDHRLLDLCASLRLCRHFHLSLQSGCAATLHRMRRPYGPRQFADLLAAIRQAVPGVAITTDWIVGFPGESEQEFEESLRFVDQMRFARIHAFPFSSRPGTEAAALQQQVPHPVKKERMQRALAISRQSASRFQRRQLDQEAQVLWETQRQGLWYGMTDNYLRVVTRSHENLALRLTTARLEEATAEGLQCVVQSSTFVAPRADEATSVDGRVSAGF